MKIEDHIYCGASELVAHLQKSFDFDWIQHNYIDSAHDWLYSLRGFELAELDMTFEDLKNEIARNPKKVCEEYEIEPYITDITNYWIVSEFLFEELKVRHEAVFDILDLKIWGRQVFNQRISMDPVIEDIIEDSRKRLEK